MIVDQYFDALDEGIEPVVPYIFRIPKGKTFPSSSTVVFNWSCSAEAPVPDPLILVHHQLGWFSLQPVRVLPLDGTSSLLWYKSGR